MRNLLYIIGFLILLTACRGTADEVSTDVGGVRIKLMQSDFLGTRLVDEDNLAIEQVINDISVFFTDPTSDAITHSFINSGFTTVDDYKLVSIPLQPAELGVKDIFVIVNHGDVDLSTITTRRQMRELRTPLINKSNNLSPEKGFCMYGKTLEFDFENAEGNAVVNVARTTVKFRITLHFLDDQTDSPDNSFVIAQAATYTFITDDTYPYLLTLDDYFNFASAIQLESDGNRYINNAYVYEATKSPQLYLYTHINGSTSPQEFSAALPVPVRNYLYDIEIYVYDDETRVAGYGANPEKTYICEIVTTAYDETGEHAGSYSQTIRSKGQSLVL